MCLNQACDELWIRFQHERLGELCCRCGRITHPTSRCLKPSRLREGMEAQVEDIYGLWMRAEEILGKYYPARKQPPSEAQEENGIPEHQQGSRSNPSKEPSACNGPESFMVSSSKKRKTMDLEIQSPTQEAAL
ncbi:hypothetical protein Tsubulata_037527 [Turnera subulata]|uniref:Zinc knuckle CX2CX4HX4C domain-containing protein n=1 Tax=Turnera subulata TaxID=218843 RepID=A0A9Q0JJT2_9ROSI|nr:hypothetical protein Tsubulata_037527 [Turnera subulata]